MILCSICCVYKWTKPPLFYPGTLPGKWEENVPAQQSLVIKPISRTAKPSVRERNGTFLYSGSVSCGCCYRIGEGCCFHGGPWVLFQSAGVGCWEMACLVGWSSWEGDQTVPPKHRLVKCSALQQKRKRWGNLATSGFY